MTHEELLAKINYDDGFFKKENALLAVVELHKPINEHPDLCDGCYEEESGPSDYPCPTIQAIEKELN